MGPVDVQRAFHSMTVPPPHPHEPAEAEGLRIEDDDRVAVAISPDETPCLEFEPGCDECEGQARDTVTRLRPILSLHSQPLNLILELLEIEFDLRHGCAERLFWLAQQRGYLSLRQGRVYLGDMPAGPPANSMVEVAPGIR
jgi:hypothetical protein